MSCAFSAHAVTSDVDLVDMAKAAEFFGSDGVIVTGTATGVQTNPEHVQGNAFYSAMFSNQNTVMTQQVNIVLQLFRTLSEFLRNSQEGM